MQKIYYKVFVRQTGTRLTESQVDTIAEINTQVLGSTSGPGQTDYDSDATKWALIGEMTSGGLVGIAQDANIKGEKGDQQALADGGNPVISEKILAELISFDVTNVSWGTAAASGARAAMPLRKRISTNVTGVNVDIAFIDVRVYQDSPTGITGYNIFAWDVPCHVGLEAQAGALAKHPITLDKEVSALEEELDVYKCPTT